MSDKAMMISLDTFNSMLNQPPLRDQFAMAAPEPDKSEIWYEFVKVEGHRGDDALIPDAEKLRVACKLRYKYADAMLKARERE